MYVNKGGGCIFLFLSKVPILPHVCLFTLAVVVLSVMVEDFTIISSSDLILV